MATTGDPRALTALQMQFPSYQIGVDECFGRSRYVARSRFLRLNPHTVITADLDELRDALSQPQPAAS